MRKKVRSKPEPSPLGEALVRFAQRLVDGGYTTSTAEQYLSICRKFDRYVTERGLEVAALSEEHVEGFIRTSPSSEGRRVSHRFFWRRPVSLLLTQLRSEGVIPQVQEARAPLGPGVAEYLTFLREHRGFVESTVERHALHVGRFLSEFEVRTEDDLRQIRVDQIDRFLVAASRGLRRQSMGAVCSSIRGFFGHLHMMGLLRTDLRSRITTPRMYSLEAMPRSVAWTDIERTFTGIDRTGLLGCRDYAMLALVAHCGLRASEVAALLVTDIDWRADRIRVRRLKKGTEPVSHVPLVSVVGEALVDYLRRRPDSPHAEVFLKVNAPTQPLTGQRVSATARRYLARAGVKSSRLGSHTLRHSFAVELLRRGHSLRAIGDALGHTHPQSTFIYAKGAVEDLREVTIDLDPVLA